MNQLRHGLTRSTAGTATDSTLLQNSSSSIHNPSFLMQNSKFLIQDSSFLSHNSSFLLTLRRPLDRGVRAEDDAVRCRRMLVPEALRELRGMSRLELSRHPPAKFIIFNTQFLVFNTNSSFLLTPRGAATQPPGAARSSTDGRRASRGTAGGRPPHSRSTGHLQSSERSINHRHVYTKQTASHVPAASHSRASAISVVI